MDSHCCARGCHSSKKKIPGLSFHQFPRDPVLCQQWIGKIGRPDFLSLEPSIIIGENYLVCSKHFQKSAFKVPLRFETQTWLHFDAIPSLNLQKSFKTTSVDRNGKQTIFMLSFDEMEDIQDNETSPQINESKTINELATNSNTADQTSEQDFLSNLADKILGNKNTQLQGETIDHPLYKEEKVDNIKYTKVINTSPDVELSEENYEDLIAKKMYKLFPYVRTQNSKTTKRWYKIEEKVCTSQYNSCPQTKRTSLSSSSLTTTTTCTEHKPAESQTSVPRNMPNLTFRKQAFDPTKIKIKPTAALMKSNLETQSINKHGSSDQIENYSKTSNFMKENLLKDSKGIYFKNALTEESYTLNDIKIKSKPCSKLNEKSGALGAVAPLSSVWVVYSDLQELETESSSSSSKKAPPAKVNKGRQTLPAVPETLEEEADEAASQCSSSDDWFMELPEEISDDSPKPFDFPETHTTSNPPACPTDSGHHSTGPPLLPVVPTELVCTKSTSPEATSSLGAKLIKQAPPTSRVQGLCRTCATSGVEMIGFFSTKGKELQLEQKIKDLLAISVCAEDGLPVQVCVRCLLMLEVAYELHQNCCKAEATLRHILQQQEQALGSMSGGPMELEDETTDQPIADTGPYTETHSLSTNMSNLQVPSKTSDVKSAKNHPPYFKCYECSKLYISMHHLLKHQRSVHGRVPIFCCKCCVCFGSKREFQDHWQELHSKRATDVTLNTQDNFLDHALKSPSNIYNSKKEDQNNELYCCDGDLSAVDPIYNKINVASKELDNQMVTKRKKKTGFVCDKCNIIFTIRSNLVFHRQKVHQKGKKCGLCSEILPGYAAYKKHQRKHRENIKKYIPVKQIEKINNSFACELCDKIFKNRSALKTHSKTHNSSRPYLCATCGQSFKTCTALSQHNFKHLPEKEKMCIECSVCDKMIRVSLFESHMQHHINNRPFSCSVCNMRCYSKTSLEAHVLSHTTQKKLHECELCKSIFKHRQRCVEHKDEHVDDKSGCIVCPVCNQFFACFDNAIEHSKTHSNSEFEQIKMVYFTRNKQFICKVCNNTFTSKIDLDEHVFKTHETKSYDEISLEYILKCNICNVSFNDVSTFVTHKKTHPEAFTVKCRQCDNRFKKIQTRNDHELIHTGEKNLSCDICSKKFRLRKHLLRHKFVHLKVKPYSCQFCDKKFRTKKYVYQHMSIHTGVRPYTCKTCGANFRTPANYQKHLLVHTAVKRYGCSKCSFRSHQVYNLKVHELRHSDITPRLRSEIIQKLKSRNYCCDLCGKKFSRRSYLDKHKIVHTRHEGQPAALTCDTCGQNFTLKDDLKVHMLTHKNVKQDISDDSYDTPNNLQYYEECDVSAIIDL